MQFAALAQKIEVVLESHWFLCRIVILSKVIVINACLCTYALDGKTRYTLTAGLKTS